MTMADVFEVNASTGEVIERDFTAEELAQREIDLQDALDTEAAIAAAISARESALTKLAALGLTEEEIAALIG